MILASGTLTLARVRCKVQMISYLATAPGESSAEKTEPEHEIGKETLLREAAADIPQRIAFFPSPSVAAVLIKSYVDS